MKVYLCGKITGLPEDEVKEKFGKAEALLEEMGYDVVNPLKLCPSGSDWHFCMKKVIPEMLKCKAIAVLPDWAMSKGATIEHSLALGLGMKIFSISIIGDAIYLNSPKYILLLKAIENVTGISYAQIAGESLDRTISDARKFFAKIAIDKLEMKSALVGELMNRDDSTARSCKYTCKTLIDTDKDFAYNYEKILAYL